MAAWSCFYVLSLCIKEVASKPNRETIGFDKKPRGVQVQRFEQVDINARQNSNHMILSSAIEG